MRLESCVQNCGCIIQCVNPNFPYLQVLPNWAVPGGLLYHLHAAQAHILLHVHSVALSHAVRCAADDLPAARWQRGEGVSRGLYPRRHIGVPAAGGGKRTGHLGCHSYYWYVIYTLAGSTGLPVVCSKHECKRNARWRHHQFLWHVLAWKREKHFFFQK